MTLRHKNHQPIAPRTRVLLRLLVLSFFFCLASPSLVGAWPWTICGDKLLGIGPLGKSDLSLFGKTLKPACDINGTFRLNYIGGRIDAENTHIFAPALDLDLNLILTATERFHLLFRPFDNGVSGAPARPSRSTQFRAKRGQGQKKNVTTKLDFRPDRAWFEMQPLTWFFPEDEVPLDINIAGGRIPLAFHNNYWMNDDVLGFSMSQNNLYLPPLSNLNVIIFGAFDEINRFDNANIGGIGAFIDYRGYFVEVTFAYVFDNTKADNRFFTGISITKQLGLTGAALRILLNEDNGVQGGPDLGALFVIETETRVFSEHLYAGEIRLYINMFYAMENWAPLTGGNVARQGFLFQTDRSIPIAALENRGVNSGGWVLGVIFNPEGDFTVTPEFGFLRDERPRLRGGRRAAGDLEQVGLGLRVQAGLAKFLLAGSTYPWYDADYDKIEQRLNALLYGAQVRTTWAQILPTAGETEHTFRFELIYDF